MSWLECILEHFVTVHLLETVQMNELVKKKEINTSKLVTAVKNFVFIYWYFLRSAKNNAF